MTAANVRLNRKLHGSCPQCAQGKLYAKSMPLHTTARNDAVGVLVAFDIHIHTVKSHGSNTCGIRSHDEFFGMEQYTPAATKSTAILAAALMQCI